MTGNKNKEELQRAERTVRLWVSQVKAIKAQTSGKGAREQFRALFAQKGGQGR